MTWQQHRRWRIANLCQQCGHYTWNKKYKDSEYCYAHYLARKATW